MRKSTNESFRVLPGFRFEQISCYIVLIIWHEEERKQPDHKTSQHKSCPRATQRQSAEMAQPVNQARTRSSAATRSPRGLIKFTSAKAVPTDATWIIGSRRSASYARSDLEAPALARLRDGSSQIVARYPRGLRVRTKRHAARVVTSRPSNFLERRAHRKSATFHFPAIT